MFFITPRNRNNMITNVWEHKFLNIRLLGYLEQITKKKFNRKLRKKQNSNTKKKEMNTTQRLKC